MNKWLANNKKKKKKKKKEDQQSTNLKQNDINANQNVKFCPFSVGLFCVLKYERP